MSRAVRIGGLVLACMLVPALASAQQPAPDAAQVQGWRAELQQIDMQLVAAQQEALQDEALSAEQAEVTAAVRAAMIESDPTLEAQLDRLTEIMTEARAAQAAGDAERIAALTVEAQGLQPAIAQAQASAIAQPAIAARIDAFQGRLHARMIEIDPDTRPLLERRAELVQRIRAAGDGA
jgi:hypothetical protein